MALSLPQWANQDGRCRASSDDANVFVYPNITNGEYATNQAGRNTRASTTVTAAPDKWISSTGTSTIQVQWNGVVYFIPFNTSVTVPKTVYDIMAGDANYVVT